MILDPGPTPEPAPAVTPLEGEAASIPDAPFEPYQGDDAFIFASFAASDAGEVYPELVRIRELGIPVWYDAGETSKGSRQARREAAAIFLLFVTPQAVSSAQILEEVHEAIDDDKMLLVIHLAETIVPGGLRLRMGDVQAILRYKMTEDVYVDELEEAVKAHLSRLMQRERVSQTGTLVDQDQRPSTAYIPRPNTITLSTKGRTLHIHYHYPRSKIIIGFIAGLVLIGVAALLGVALFLGGAAFLSSLSDFIACLCGAVFGLVGILLLLGMIAALRGANNAKITVNPSELTLTLDPARNGSARADRGDHFRVLRENIR